MVAESTKDVDSNFEIDASLVKTGEDCLGHRLKGDAKPDSTSQRGSELP